MSIHWGALRPENEAPRRPWPVERGTANFVNNDSNADSAKCLRLQRLRALGVSGFTANLVAELAWGMAA